MSLVDKFKNYITATDFNDEEYMDDEFAYEEEYDEPIMKTERFEKPVSPVITKTDNEKILSMNAKKDYEIVYFSPENATGATQIAKSFKEGKLCIINVMGLSDFDAQTMADFIAGAAFALNGAVKSISDEIFIAIPSSISYKGDFYEDIAKFSASPSFFR